MTPRFRLSILGCSHFCVDSYATMLAPVLPLINERHGLSLAMAGFLGMIPAICNVTQPLMGIWGDRMSSRALITFGALMAAVFIPLLGIAPNFPTLAGVLLLGGIGVAAFHPQSFSLVGEISSASRATGIAVYAFAGTIGIGFTPLWMPLFVENFGLQFLSFASVPGIIFAALVGIFVTNRKKSTANREAPAGFGALRGSEAVLALITVVVILRTVTFVGFGFFLTQLGRERGLTLVEGGIPLAVYNLAGVTGSLFLGMLADRWNTRIIVLVSIFIACPALLAYLQSEGPISYLWLVVGGIGIMGSNAILVAVAQEIAPGNVGFASSLPLGFSWGLASLSLPLIGYLGDHIGIAGALHYLALLPLVTVSLAVFLPFRCKE